MFSPKLTPSFNRFFCKLMFRANAILFVVCSSEALPAQSFEGTLQFVTKTEITDPEKRREMEEQMKQAREALTGPEMEKSIQQLEEQMKKPEFQKQMESNPELKKMMENQLAQLKKMRADALANPGGSYLDQASIRMSIKIREGDVLTAVGGMTEQLMNMYNVGTVTLCRKADNKCYQINHQDKTYSEIKNEKDSLPSNDWKFSVTPLPGDTTIQGFACRKYGIKMTSKSENKTMNGSVWAAPSLNFPVLNNTWQNTTSTRAFTAIQGMPLHMVMDVSEDMRMTMYLESFKREQLKAADFALPAGYKKE